MEEAEALYLMGNLMRAQYRAHRAIIRVGRARAPEQENMQLRYLGTSLVVMGTINAAVAYQAFINPNTTYLHVIISVVLGFMFVSGITAMAIGWLLFVKDNPRKHSWPALLRLLCVSLHISVQGVRVQLGLIAIKVNLASMSINIIRCALRSCMLCTNIYTHKLESTSEDCDVHRTQIYFWPSDH